jgi:hypothetical protein
MSDNLTLYRTLIEFVWQNGVRFHDLRCLSNNEKGFIKKKREYPQKK